MHGPRSSWHPCDVCMWQAQERSMSEELTPSEIATGTGNGSAPADDVSAYVTSTLTDTMNATAGSAPTGVRRARYPTIYRFNPEKIDGAEPLIELSATVQGVVCGAIALILVATVWYVVYYSRRRQAKVSTEGVEEAVVAASKDDSESKAEVAMECIGVEASDDQTQSNRSQGNNVEPFVDSDAASDNL